MGGARERIRLKGDSVAYMEVSVDKKEIFVYGDRMHLARKEQAIYNELGLQESLYVDVDSMLVARQAKHRFQFEFMDTTTLLLKGKIRNDSVFIQINKERFSLDNGITVMAMRSCVLPPFVQAYIVG
jgi:hypothetical protein